MESGNRGLVAVVMKLMLVASTTFTSETGENQLRVSDASSEARRYENNTSSASKVDPSWNVTPSRRVNRYPSPSPIGSHPTASAGSMAMSLPRRTNPS